MYITIDIGGTYIRVGASYTIQHPELIDLKKFTTSNNYDQDFQKIVSAIKSLSQENNIYGIGIGIPGTFENKNSIYKSPNLWSWEKHNPSKDLENIFHCPVIVKNDTATAALGEALFEKNNKVGDNNFIIYNYNHNNFCPSDD